MTEEEKAAAAADKKAKAEAKAQAAAEAKAEVEAKANQPKRVRVICEGTLGPLLLKTGEETDDPRYVAILEQKGQRKVELVK